MSRMMMMIANVEFVKTYLSVICMHDELIAPHNVFLVDMCEGKLSSKHFTEATRPSLLTTCELKETQNCYLLPHFPPLLLLLLSRSIQLRGLTRHSRLFNLQ